MKENKTMKNRLSFPKIHIENKGRVTKVYVDGKMLNGIRSINFLHNGEKDGRPILRIELLAEQISIDTAQTFDLPEVYRPYYVSSDKLVSAGILTYDQLNNLLEKKQL